MTIPHTNAHHARLVTQFQMIMVDAGLKRHFAPAGTATLKLY
jgi:hypothetical protein